MCTLDISKQTCSRVRLLHSCSYKSDANHIFVLKNSLKEAVNISLKPTGYHVLIDPIPCRGPFTCHQQPPPSRPTLVATVLRSPPSLLISPSLCKVIPRAKLPVQALARLEFGEHLLAVLGLADTVTVQVAKNLPPVLMTASGGRAAGNNSNAFRNSYLWDAATRVLNLHGKSPITYGSGGRGRGLPHKKIWERRRKLCVATTFILPHITVLVRQFYRVDSFVFCGQCSWYSLTFQPNMSHAL